MRFVTLVSTIVLAILFILSVSSIAYATSPSGYTYVKTHTIIGSSDGALDHYQVMLIVHSGAGVDDGRDVYLNGHSLSWPDDIRFTGINDNVLNYWIESSDANSATVWVNVDSIPAFPDTTTIKLYYGKANDPGASSGDSTFLLFDDFSGSNFNMGEWTKMLGPGARVTQQHGELDFFGGGSDNDRPLVRSNAQFGRNIIVTATTKVYTVQLNVGSIISLSMDWDGNTGGEWAGPNDAYTLEYNGNGGNSISILKQVSGDALNLNQATITPDTNWHKMSIAIDNSGNIKGWLDGALTNTASDTSYTSGYIGLVGREGPIGIEEAFKNVYIRNWTPNEPSQGSWGAEMASQLPIPQWLVYLLIIILLLFVIVLVLVLGFASGYIVCKKK
jgi:hypothetical protein